MLTRPFDTLFHNIAEIIIEVAIFMVSMNYVAYFYTRDDDYDWREKVIIGF